MLNIDIYSLCDREWTLTVANCSPTEVSVLFDSRFPVVSERKDEPLTLPSSPSAALKSFL